MVKMASGAYPSSAGSYCFNSKQDVATRTGAVTPCGSGGQPGGGAAALAADRTVIKPPQKLHGAVTRGFYAPLVL